MDIAVEEVTLSQYEDLIGLKAHVRKDSALYADIETDKEKRRGSRRKPKQRQRRRRAGRSTREGAGEGGAKSFFRITVKDNGKGMAYDDIPNMLGRVLSGTKYGVRQTRGKFGLGSKMALIWSKQTTGLPIKITSAQPSKFTPRIEAAGHQHGEERAERAQCGEDAERFRVARRRAKRHHRG